MPLYLEASPKAISERTSYLQVRLEFLRYPHLIPALFNVRGFRTSSKYYLTFILDMGRSPGFGSTTCYLCAYSDSLSLRLRFFRLTLQQIVTRRFILQKARYHPLTGSNLFVGTRFQELFHSPSGVLFTFPSRYWFTIGH